MAGGHFRGFWVVVGASGVPGACSGVVIEFAAYSTPKGASVSTGFGHKGPR